MKPTKPTKPMWKPGDPVSLPWGSDIDSKPELGRVVDMQWDSKYGWWDVRVAFYGTKWPTNKTIFKETPYMLKYLETALKPFKPPKEKR